MHTAVERVLQGVLAVIFPRRCPCCDRPVKPVGADICKECEGAFKRLQEPLCYRCGKPLSENEKDREYCRDCTEHEHAFDRAYSLFEYGSVRQSVYRFKYMGRREYASYYAKCFVKAYAGSIGDREKSLPAAYGGGLLAEGRRIEALIPVPLHKMRYRKRGYNQAECFARELSRLTGVALKAGLVKRVKNTKPMKTLDSAGRRNNLKNAFIIGKNDVSLNCVAIVDDIYTTGSTVDAVAALLKRQGIRYVYVFTVAMGRQ